MKILFRKIRNADLKMIMNWRNLSEVTRYMYTDPKITIKDQKKWFEDLKSDETKIYWIINVDDIDVGIVGLYRIDNVNRRCEWEYYIASPDARGKGIGKAVELNVQYYVFQILKLNKLCCEVFCWNDIVITIHKKYGSKIEGKRIEHIYKNGEFFDIVEMAIIRNDWENYIKEKFLFPTAIYE